MTWFSVVQVAAIAGCVLAMFLNMRAWWGWRRRCREERALTLLHLAEETHLTPLQAQVALDAAMATFTARVAEMQAGRGR